MFERIPNTRVMQEPFSFTFVWTLYLTGKVSLVEYEKILDSTFRVQCKKETGIKHIVIKIPTHAAPALLCIKRAHPEVKLLFNTRHPISSLKSYQKLWSLLPVSGTIAILFNIPGYEQVIPIPCNDAIWWEHYRSLVKEGGTLNRQLALCRYFFFNYWCVFEQYLKNKDLYCQTTLYEDLCEKPTQELEKLFSSLSISLEYIPDALEALKSDSQNGFFDHSSAQADFTKTINELNDKFKEMEIPMSMNVSLEEMHQLLAN